MTLGYLVQLAIQAHEVFHLDLLLVSDEVQEFSHGIPLVCC